MYRIILLWFVCSVFVRTGGRIINGGDVNTPGKYSWQGSLEIDGKFHAGVILVIPNAALTTASVISGVGSSNSRMTVTFGLHDKDTKLEGQPETYQVLNTQTYPYYSDELGYPNNLAILQLNGSVNLDNEYISTIAIPEAGRTPTDWLQQDCFATGWGQTNISSPATANILQEAMLHVILPDECVSAWTSIGYPETVITGGEVCATDRNNQTGTCQGDDGGPFVCVQDDGSYEFVGITSWRGPKCEPDLPSVFTMVSFYHEWIMDKLPIP